MSRFVLILLSLLFSFAAEAQTLVQHKYAEVELLVEYNELVLGESVGVGIEIRPLKGWHSYWRNPGDSGAPPKIKWEVPAGIEIGPLEWPQPDRIEASGIVTYGYKHPTLLFSHFRIPFDTSWKVGDVVSLVVQSEWLVCDDICVPVFANFKKELKIVSAEAATLSQAKGKFQRARANLPRYAKDLFKFKVLDSKNAFSFLITPHKPEFEVLDFFPAKGMEVDLKKPEIKKVEKGYSFELSRLGESPKMSGLIIYRDAKAEKIFSAWLENESSRPVTSLALILLFAFMGGFLLNLMPCVFPVVSMKAFSVIKHSQAQKKKIIQESLAYTFGVLFTFILIAIVLLVIRNSGEAIGWGFQLQSPWFVSLIALLFFVLGLNFFGIFEFQFSFVGIGQKSTELSGNLGQFFTGVLSVVVASPCTAPFMGAALGYALTQGTPTVLFIFISLGLGLAFPYLLLAFMPGLAKVLPRPGSWMNTFKQFLAFPIWATMIWLLWLLSQQIGTTASFVVVTSFLFVAMAIWWRYQIKPESSLIRNGLSLLFMGLAAYCLIQAQTLASPPQAIRETSAIEWVKFSSAQLEGALARNERVFVDFTADWCLTCKVNEKLTFSNKKVQAFIRDHKMTMVKADWTNRNPEITQILESYKRIGVPLYLYYRAGQKRAEILPEILTPNIFMSTIKEIDAR